MRLKNDINGRNLLREIISMYYEKNGHRYTFHFLETKNEDWGWHYQHYLLDRKHIIKYGIGDDRNTELGSLELAIGPHYFGPAHFWSYENSERFKISASTEAVEHNLKLLDEFLGYAPPSLPPL